MMTLKEAIELITDMRNKAEDQEGEEKDVEALDIAIDCMLSVEIGDV